MCLFINLISVENDKNDIAKCKFIIPVIRVTCFCQQHHRGRFNSNVILQKRTWLYRARYKIQCSKWFRLFSVSIIPYNQQCREQLEKQQVAWPRSGRLSLNGVHAVSAATSDSGFQLSSILPTIRYDYIDQKCSGRQWRSSENGTKINAGKTLHSICLL